MLVSRLFCYITQLCYYSVILLFFVKKEVQIYEKLHPSALLLTVIVMFLSLSLHFYIFLFYILTQYATNALTSMSLCMVVMWQFK